MCQPAVILAPRDCSDYNVLETRKNGVYRVTPDPRNSTFEVFCNMESYGGGWTVIQQRLDGSVSFNRTWAEYKKGFGNLRYASFVSKVAVALHKSGTGRSKYLTCAVDEKAGAQRAGHILTFSNRC